MERPDTRPLKFAERARLRELERRVTKAFESTDTLGDVRSLKDELEWTIADLMEDILDGP